MSFRARFELELIVYQLQWCRECCAYGNHKRGFAEGRTVHLDSEIATRSSLHRGLHEIGHLIHDQTGMHRWEREAQANEWAERRMRELGIPVPRKVAAAGRAYEKRMKRWGDNIKRGRSE
jgi:hypothetical protein